MAPRRRMLLFRLVLYGVLGAIVAAVLLTRPHDDGSELRRVHALTADGEPLVLKLDHDGVLRSWDVEMDGRCSNGSADTLHWYPDDDGTPARITHRDGVVDAVEVARRVEPGVGPWTIRSVLHADVTGERAIGTFRYRKAYADAGYGFCAGGPIRFSVPLG